MYYTDHPRLAKTPEERAWRADEYKRLRSALHVSQRELASISGLTVNTINQMPCLSSGRYPSLLVLTRMRAALDHKQRDNERIVAF
ncbi:helix-turn-helix domain-containing protein [Ochrobactrum quorumnocens]|uniref:helix-turn-helix domain-containing protein n=1 Tax=Ochrobactrum quorumnocens TaxID=271865 RepID=UPI003BA1ABFD